MALMSIHSVIGADTAPKAQGVPTENPHGDASSCLTCHLSTDANEPFLKEEAGGVSGLCRSCHVIDQPIHEMHLFDSGSNAGILDLPPDIPLENGRLTCLSCHDVTPNCRQETKRSESNPHFLRNADQENPLTFCSSCHAEQDRAALNVHDQLEAGRINPDTCNWCHIRPPSEESFFPDTATYPVRPHSSDICNNCHSVADNHPTGGPHLDAKPSDEMIWYMSANELRSRMNLSIKELMVFVRAAKRTPRSIPLDDRGRIICATCHNPHEVGLFRNGSDRAVGAEPKHAVNSRLRAPKGKMCLTCHQL